MSTMTDDRKHNYTHTLITMSSLLEQDNDIENNLSEQIRENQYVYNDRQHNETSNWFMLNLIRRLLLAPSDTIHYEEDITISTVPTPFTVFAEQFYVNERDEICCVCVERREIDDICRLNCQHTFCIYCTYEHVQQQNTRCQVCRTEIITIQTQTLETKQLFNGSDA